MSAAISGGVSDPRNSAILKMFNFIDIGERAGSGIPNIYRVWNEQKMPAPIISEEFDPDRVTLILPITSAIIGDKSAITNNNEGSAIKTGDKSAINAAARDNILYYLTDHPDGRTAEIAEYLGLGESRTRDYMRILTEEGLLESFGANRNRRYRLKR